MFFFGDPTTSETKFSGSLWTININMMSLGLKLLILVMVIPSLIGNPYNYSHINRYYWVDFPIPTIGKPWEFRPDGIYLPQPGRSCFSFLLVQSASFNLSRNSALRPTTGCNEDGQQAYLRSRVIFAGKDVWRKVKHIFCLVVEPTHPKKIDRQNGNLPQIGAKIKDVWNHHLVFLHSNVLLVLSI